MNLSDTPLPASPSAEKGIISSFFLSPQSVGAILAERKVNRTHFSIPAHQELFEALRTLWTEGKPIDFVTVSDHLKSLGKLEEVGWVGGVLEVSGYIPTAANASSYIDTLIEHHKLRQLILTCVNAAETGTKDGASADNLIEDVSSKLLGLVSDSKADEEPDICTLVQQVTDDLDEAYRTRGKPRDCLSTGFDELDGFLNGGIRQSDTIVISAPTKGGKSILADNILEHITINLGKPAALFSLEMPAKERIKRILASNGRVPLTAMIRGWLTPHMVGNLDGARKRLANAKLVVRSRMVQFAQIQAAIRQINAKHPDLALVVIDYLQLVEAEQGKSDTRELVVGTISRKFRQMATTMDIPFIIVCQENDDGRARESRRIEMDCTTFLKIRDGSKEDTKTVEVSFNRNGPNGKFTLTHQKQILRFETCTESESTQ